MAAILKKMPVLLLIFAIVVFCGCEKKQEDSDSYEWNFRSLSLTNHSPEEIFIEEIYFAPSQEWGGKLPGGNWLLRRTRSISPPRGPLPYDLKIYWVCENKKYHKTVKINLPIKDKRIFEEVFINFDKDKCWLTYYYILGDVMGDHARLNNFAVELNEDGSLTERERFLISKITYLEKPEVRKMLMKGNKNGEANKN